jgi:polysaccharide export outer membrane protein
MKLRFLLFSTLAVFLLSCRTIPKDVSYFQDMETYISEKHTYSLKNYEPTIRVEDQLSIGVSAPIPNQEAVAQFNPPLNMLVAGDITTMQPSQAMPIYTVDMEGNINFPVLGYVKVAGLSKANAIKLLQDKISAYIPSPTVSIQILSFKVTVLGEVLHPGQTNISDEKISILDAIGLAGDLTIYGNRKNVLLIRENQGIKEFVRFDLTKAETFSSPYYYLQQNDIIVVEPNEVRKSDSTYSASKSYELSTVSVIISSLSVLSTVAILIYNITK